MIVDKARASEFIFKENLHSITWMVEAKPLVNTQITDRFADLRCMVRAWTPPLILRLVQESPWHLKGWVMGALLEGGKLKTDITGIPDSVYLSWGALGKPLSPDHWASQDFLISW